MKMKWDSFFGRDVIPHFSCGMDVSSDATTIPDTSMKIDTLLDCDPTAMGDVWKSYTFYPPDSINNRHRQRSRSSPVRTTEGKNISKVRERSPSAGSPRRCMRERHSARPAYIRENASGSNCSSEVYLQPGGSYWCGPGNVCGTAYFSLRPPVAPLRLVPIPTPAPPPVYPGVTSFKLVPSPTNTSLEGASVVKSIVSDLIQFLPLAIRKPSNPERTVHTPIYDEIHATRSTRSNVKMRKNRSADSQKRKNDENRSVAIQAKYLDDEASVQDNGQQLADFPDGWLGGVRALRDSHVKLVLRQLRHINRLNRTLDRAVRLSTPPPTPRACVHASSVKL